MEVAGNYLYAISNGSIACYDLLVEVLLVLKTSWDQASNGMISWQPLVVSDFSWKTSEN